MDPNLIFLLKICHKLEIGVVRCLCKVQTMYEEASLYMSWLLSKMSSDRMGCLTLKVIEIDGHLNNILHVTTWFE